MKIKNILLIVSFFCYVFSYSQESIIELPITFKQGFGPFGASLRLDGLRPYSDDADWSKTYLKVAGIPKEWADVKYGDIETNIYQMAYQNYILGNITREFYEYLQNVWDWLPDTTNLSKEPLKTKVAYAYGKDSFGITKMVVDANNNLDFRDDEVFTPMEIETTANNNFDSLILKNTFKVTYERLSNNKIIKEIAPFFIVYMKDLNMNMYTYCFPQYAIARFNDKEIAICSGGFSNINYIIPEIGLVNDSIKDVGKVGCVNKVSKNEYITINGNIYQFKGVNLNKNVLIMEKMHLPQTQLVSAKIGYKTLPFEGIDFKTRSVISLDNYKGKYLLIDFWSVLCAPCIQELPNLKKLYDNLDKSKFGIIGIVGQSQPNALEKLINTYSISWPQILSDDTNDIIKKYGIRDYPRTILIDPDGIIIEKDLRGNDLENKIKELIGDK